MGDARTYEFVCTLRAVTSQDGMTANYYYFKHTDLSEISNKIVNEVPGINRVVYDTTSKPPGTIEWEWLMKRTIVIFFLNSFLLNLEYTDLVITWKKIQFQ